MPFVRYDDCEDGAGARATCSWPTRSAQALARAMDGGNAGSRRHTQSGGVCLARRPTRCGPVRWCSIRYFRRASPSSASADHHRTDSGTAPGAVQGQGAACMTGASTVNWVGEGAPKPLSRLAFTPSRWTSRRSRGSSHSLKSLFALLRQPLKRIVRDELAAVDHDSSWTRSSLIRRRRRTPIRPRRSPTGITASRRSARPAAALIEAISTRLMASVPAANNLSLGNAVVDHDATARDADRLMLNSLGQQNVPGIARIGGTLAGMPVVASENIPSTTGSPEQKVGR